MQSQNTISAPRCATDTTETAEQAEERQAMAWVDLAYEAARAAAVRSNYDRAAVNAAVQAEQPPAGTPPSWANKIIEGAVGTALRGVPTKGSDQDITDRFERAHGHDLLYSGKNWYCWRTNHGWLLDNTSEVGRIIQNFCRRESQNEPDKKIAHRLASSGLRFNIEKLAAERLTVAADAWDTDEWMLGTPCGIVDLNTGQLRPHTRDDLISKRAAVTPSNPHADPDPYRDCPQWGDFLKWATKDDAGLQNFLQRFCGYSLTGDFSEQVFIYIWGPGGNGKGTLVNLMGEMLASYSTVADVRSLMPNRNGYIVHSTETAKLRGARIAIFQETGAAFAIDEAKIKSLTGGDKITARLIKRDNIDFLPTFKLWFTSNHKPLLGQVDDALRRRIHVVNFEQKYQEQDRRLPEKLKTEWPAILRWMIEGCLKWKASGLQVPQCVTDASQEYLTSQDAVGEWLNDCCLQDPSFMERTMSLWKSWEAWAKQRKDTDIPSYKALVAVLKGRGFKNSRTVDVHRRSIFTGLKLRPSGDVEG